MARAEELAARRVAGSLTAATARDHGRRASPAHRRTLEGMSTLARRPGPSVRTRVTEHTGHGAVHARGPARDRGAAGDPAGRGRSPGRAGLGDDADAGSRLRARGGLRGERVTGRSVRDRAGGLLHRRRPGPRAGVQRRDDDRDRRHRHRPPARRPVGRAPPPAGCAARTASPRCSTSGRRRRGRTRSPPPTVVRGLPGRDARAADRVRQDGRRARRRRSPTRTASSSSCARTSGATTPSTRWSARGCWPASHGARPASWSAGGSASSSCRRPSAGGIGSLVAVGAPTSLAVRAGGRGGAGAVRLHRAATVRAVRLTRPSRRGLPGLVGAANLGSSHAHPAHLRLAPGEVLPPRRTARPPGRVRRPPARGRRDGAGRRRRRRPATSTTAPCPTSTPCALADEAFARLAASRASVVVTQRQPRLRPAPRLRHPADRRGRRLHPHRRPHGRHARSLLEDEHGTVAIHGLPYLDPTAMLEPWALPARSHEIALSEAMRRVRADLATRPAHPLRRAGARLRRRRAAVGVRARHQRRRRRSCPDQRLRRHRLRRPRPPARPARRSTEHIRYSGSPLAYSFSEADQVKGSWLVDLGADGRRVRALRRGTGPPPAGPTHRRRSTSLLADPDLAAHEHDWVQVTLTDALRPAQAMERLRRRFPHTLVLAFAPTGAAPAAHPPPASPAAATTTSRSTSCATCAACRPRPPRPTCCSRPSTPAATTPTRTSWSGRAADAPARPAASPPSARSPTPSRSTSTRCPTPGSSC